MILSDKKAYMKKHNKKYRKEHLEYFKKYGESWRKANPNYMKNYLKDNRKILEDKRLQRIALGVAGKDNQS